MIKKEVLAGGTPQIGGLGSPGDLEGLGVGESKIRCGGEETSNPGGVWGCRGTWGVLG